MAKHQQRNKNKTQQANKTAMRKKNSKFDFKKYESPLAVILIGLLLVIFLWKVLDNGSFWNASDNISGQSFSKYWEQADKFPLWNPYIFGGLPGFAAMQDGPLRSWDITYGVVHYAALILKDIFNSDAARVMLWYLVLGSGIFFMVRRYVQDKSIAFLSAVSFIFCTGVIVWMFIGHNAKPMTFAWAPWVFVMMERIKERCSLFNIVLMTLVMHLLLAGNHVQMVFYTACAVGIYLIVDIIARIVKKNNVMATIRLVGVFIIATIIAVLMSSDRYFSTLEYAQYSTRGTSPITERMNGKTPKDVSKKSKADYDYATMWSNSPEELIDLLVPSYHGFGKVDYEGSLANNNKIKINTYWGQKPFEDATPYLSAIILFLALLGIVRYIKDTTIVQAMTITLVFSILLSFGYNFPLLYDIFFYHFPKFSSFRAPVMVLVLFQLACVILSGFGIKALKEMRDEFTTFGKMKNIDKAAFYTFVAAIGIFFIAGLIFNVGLEDSYIAKVEASKNLVQGYGEQVVQQLAPFIYNNAANDWLVIGGLCLASIFFVYLFIKKTLPQPAFIGIMLILVLIDLWRMDYRAMDYTEKSIETYPFQQTDVISFIQEDARQSGEKFRVCDMSTQVQNSDAYFFIENVNGYHPAKLRTFQDMMDVMCDGSTSIVTHPFMWRVMNVKYIITTQKLSDNFVFQSRNNGAYVYYNYGYCPRAFFVDSAIVADDTTIIKKMDSSVAYDPNLVAYIEKPLNAKLDKFPISPTTNTDDSNTPEITSNKPQPKITEYKNEYIKIETETLRQHLLVLSEMYYPDWTAYIDGKEVETFKTNFAFRSIVVPSGKHIVEFKFESKPFETGKTLSTISNIIVVLVLHLGIFLEIRRKKKDETSEQ